ncbi:arsenite efflux transporter metallochaperone ArsD [Thalassoglobus polymorphus]|uniref:Arsenical resistance operon trans-acting repressor ArsD n=1 Tax=Thalassoglobus polymorphus TaxID=2527994 RepID=A0A517QN70_9PLAN|nr:arsenite efflux transporter metallochaperone ArsD [Thalassoglobus polymorphus]QDT33017.1 Arsenical resistance operon trans-acting repressor ArsD [Thalassoglobus polymorphus]
MSKIQIYDPAMCCSSGVCGPQVDPVLPRFASDLEWLKSKGHQVERFNLGQQPAEYASNPTVQQLLQAEGVDCLPLVLVDGRVMSRSEYPTRENLALWTGTQLKASALPVVSDEAGDCCGSSGCC